MPIIAGTGAWTVAQSPDLDWSNLLYVLLFLIIPALNGLGKWIRERSTGGKASAVERKPRNDVRRAAVREPPIHRPAAPAAPPQRGPKHRKARPVSPASRSARVPLHPVARRFHVAGPVHDAGPAQRGVAPQRVPPPARTPRPVRTAAKRPPALEPGATPPPARPHRRRPPRMHVAPPAVNVDVTPSPPVAPRHADGGPTHGAADMLRHPSRADLRRAIVMNEILGPPRGIRSFTFGCGS
ncbi:MAG: hypothetical protein ACE5E6_01705 [Phycisphaerae bacterium]